MKTKVLVIAACLLSGSITAAPVADDGQSFVFNENELEPLAPTFLDNVYGSDPWGSNWFLSVKGGMNVFLGKPVGHGDIFDRIKPGLSVSAGKWFSPQFGARLSYEGFSLYDSFIESRKFQSIHMDLMYNISSIGRRDYETLPRWDVIVFGGAGIIRNSFTHKKPFAFSYGLITKYRLTRRLHAMAELGGTTTFQDFDGIGASNKLGDHLFHASLGLSMTIGKVGFQRIIDPKPYILQNDILMEYIGKMKEDNTKLNKERMKDALALQQMRKILEIEGLLEKYDLEMPEEEQIKAHPKNNYSGLNSLRARLRNKNWGEENEVTTRLADNQEYQPIAWNDKDSTNINPMNYFRLMKDGKIFVGTPIFIFFKLAKDELTEPAQMINIREIASTIKRFGLSARIVGAADSQTGTAFANEKLSAKRADYVASLLRKNGVPEERINTQYQGGINTYVPLEGNRNTCIMLYFNK